MKEGEGGVEDSVAHPPGQAEASQLPRASARAALCFLTPGLAQAPARFEGVRLKPRERPTPELDTGRGCLDTTGPSLLTCAGSARGFEAPHQAPGPHTAQPLVHQHP